MGDKQEPCGTPAAMFLLFENELSMRTLNDRFEMKSCMILYEVLYDTSLWISPSCHTRSKAFSMSKNTAAVLSLLFAFMQRLSTKLASWKVVEC